MDSLMERFDSMGTTDRDVLIQQFQFYTAAADGQSATFFLEMNHWSLQDAVGAYFELQGQNQALPGMSLVRDLTIGEGEAVGPEKIFTKKWRLHNSAKGFWPEGCHLAYTRGDSIGPCTKVNMPVLEPGGLVDVELSMLAPRDSGHYCSEWRMCMADGTFFGDTVWVIIQVEADGLLDLTQQMDSLSTSAEAMPASFCSVSIVTEDRLA